MKGRAQIRPPTPLSPRPPPEIRPWLLLIKDEISQMEKRLRPFVPVLQGSQTAVCLGGAAGEWLQGGGAGTHVCLPLPSLVTFPQWNMLIVIITARRMIKIKGERRVSCFSPPQQQQQARYKPCSTHWCLSEGPMVCPLCIQPHQKPIYFTGLPALLMHRSVCLQLATFVN